MQWFHLWIAGMGMACSAVFAQVRPGASGPALSERLDAVIDQAVLDRRIVGTVVLVARDGQIAHRRAAGWADREAERPMREDTVFRLSSMTKPLVSAAALALADEGKLELDDPVTRWIPEFRPELADGRTPEITIRHLLTHTAGLSYGFLEPEDGPYHRLGVSDGLDRPPFSLAENLRRIAAAPLQYEPGKNWGYSVATDVLGEVLSRAGGAPLPQVIRERVTGPLGMDDTGFFAASADRLATPYANATPEPVRMTDPHRLPYGPSAIVYAPSRALDPNVFPSGGAGAIGTAGDYLKFLETIRRGGNPILRPASAQALTSPAVGDLAVAAGPGWSWSLGFAVLKDPSPTGSPQQAGSYQWGGVYGHTWWVDPQAALTVVILTNTALEGMSGGGRFPEDIKAAIYSQGHSR